MILCFSQAQELDDEIIIPKRVELKQSLLPDEIVLGKRITVESKDNIVPNIAKQTLLAFREDTNIFIKENNYLENEGIPDIGQAERSDYFGRRPNECVVSFNETSLAFTNTTNNNVFVIMNINNNIIKEFIFLHEFAHCHDGELPNKNVDSIEWREALADGYAMATLLDSNVINAHKINIFKKEREKYNAVGSVLMLNKIVDFYNTNLKDLHLTPVERLNKIKILRKSIFAHTLEKI